MLIIDKPAFLILAGNKWFDNLHIAVVRYVVTPNVAAISVSHYLRTYYGLNVFLTNMTFQGEGGRSARAFQIISSEGLESPSFPSYGYTVYRHAVLVQGVFQSSLHWRTLHRHGICGSGGSSQSLVAGCADTILRGFGGDAAPLLITSESFATFHNCTFEDFELSVEVFDISFGGLLRVEDCTFRDVVLRRRKLVSTTANDDVPCSQWGGPPAFSGVYRYLPGDDERYDIHPQRLPGRPAGEFYVTNATLSDCLRGSYRCRELGKGDDYSENVAHPGCPDESVRKRLMLKQNRCIVDYILEVDPSDAPSDLYISKDYTGGPMSAPPSYAYDPNFPIGSWTDCYNDPYGIDEIQGTTGYRFGFPTDDHVWLRTVRQVRPSAPGSRSLVPRPAGSG